MVGLFYCSSINTIEHHLFTCKKSNFWGEKFKKWLKVQEMENIKVGYKFQECVILFGIPYKTDKLAEFGLQNAIS